MQDFVIDNLTLLILLIVGISLLLFLIKMAKNFSKPIEKNSLQDAILGLGEQVRILGEGQQQLTGSLRTITEHNQQAKQN